MRELQPDISGYMASLDTTNKDLEMCPSCQRALIYGAMMYAGSVKAEVDQIDASIKNLDPAAGAQAIRAAVQHAGVLVEILAEFIKTDLLTCLPGAEDLSPEDWSVAMASFFEARSEHYVGKDGKLIFEPHGTEGGEPAEVGA